MVVVSTCFDFQEPLIKLDSTHDLLKHLCEKDEVHNYHIEMSIFLTSYFVEIQSKHV